MSRPLIKLYRYVDALTSLSLLSFEKLQVANYGVGGHYGYHTDFPQRSEVLLSDVEEGGATAFPEIGEIVYPEEGKALFWYNLYPSGKGNDDTTHVACPVIAGDKWVANIWIQSIEQVFSRPCNLEENDTQWRL